MPNKHSDGYHKNYRKKIIQDAMTKYGNKCSCNHCILPEGHETLRIVINKKVTQGTYGIALYLKRMKYKKNLAKIFCLDCSPSCDHAYPRTYKQLKPKTRKTDK